MRRKERSKGRSGRERGEGRTLEDPYLCILNCVEGLLCTLVNTVFTDVRHKYKTTPLLCYFVRYQGNLINLNAE